MAASASAASSTAERLPGAVSFIPEERLPAVREAFRMFDTAGAGDIAVDELAGVLRALRYSVTADELAWFAETSAKDGRISYPKVLEIVGSVHNRKRGVNAVISAFKVSEPLLRLAARSGHHCAEPFTTDTRRGRAMPAFRRSLTGRARAS